MSKFYVSLSRGEMASQIASLINKYNKLYKKHNRYTVLNNGMNYFVEVVHCTVVGCSGTIKRSNQITEIKHVCTNPAYRQRGIAKKLVNISIANCDTEFVYISVREDNVASLSMVTSLGFSVLEKRWSVDHYVIILGRMRDYEKWQETYQQT